ncbi:MAG: cystathionine beta-synthase [Actinomycetia bacterium]|nr:cystathionine beta-synthase [Actinomycetes bacterium]MCP3910038.1 cystathionine beta-synthase [Actinomycetes bacterium]MCP4086627.1 cystathionine beta-synthase [Actinomycetes bacterium]
MEIADSVLDLVGNTPLVRMPQVAGHLACPVVVKLELMNPGGSSKDRPAVAMIDAAEREGLLKPGGTIVEPTSGNTGVGLAIVAAQRGYRCVFVMTDKVAEEKVQLLRAYGAEVVVCPVAVPPEDPESYYSTAERLVNEIPGAFRPNQYHNPVNPQSHFDHTGPEIWRQTDGKVTHFVAGAGTGGTLTGVGQYLKAVNPDVQIVAADPEGSVYSGGSGRPYLVEGVGEDFWPDTYDPEIIDQVIAVSDLDSFSMARRVAQDEGILLGGSCGTAIAAALRLAEGLTADDLVVVLAPDSGRGYLSKVFNDDWMEGFGFIPATGGVSVADVVGTKAEHEAPELIYVNPDATARDAVLLMRKNGVSQMPVAKNDMPLAAAEVMGSVNELRLMEAAFADHSVLDRPVEEVMGPSLPTIGIGQSIESVVELLDTTGALLVLDGGRPRTVISRTDVLNHLSPDTGI